jgi:hypothetical protein
VKLSPVILVFCVETVVIADPCLVARPSVAARREAARNGHGITR